MCVFSYPSPNPRDKSYIAQIFPDAIFADVVEGLPKTCHEVQISGGDEGYHFLDPDQDGLDPISVFCNMSRGGGY